MEKHNSQMKDSSLCRDYPAVLFKKITSVFLGGFSCYLLIHLCYTFGCSLLQVLIVVFAIPGKQVRMLFLLLTKKHNAVIFQYTEEELIRYIYTGIPGLALETFWNFLPFLK